MPPAGRTIVQRGRAKAYRPMPETDRRAALAAGLAAYERGDFFLAHEILEPAWMGASDHAERDLYQGLIKLSAAFVHGARHNPAGIARNLVGARELLTGAIDAGRAVDLDVAAILRGVDERLEILETPTTAGIEPIPIARRRPDGR
jgi:predicted metal-dependent hydrolase